MEMIAPQARDLAEQNGIDWRNIRGTGAGGQIVEADILGYLTRLMFGEEELPSTPVDLPPPDWEGDVASLSMNTQSLAAAGIDSDITDFITQQRDSVPAVTTDAATETNEDALDFELELDEEVAEPASMTTPPAVAASHEAFEDDFGDLDVSTPAAPAFAASAPAEPEPAAPAIAGGLLSSLYGRSATPQPEPVQPPVSQPEPVEVEVEPEVEVAAEAQPEPVFTAPAEVEPTEVQFAEIEVTEAEPVVAAVPVAEAQPEVAPVEPVVAEPVMAEPVAAEVQPAAPVEPAHHEPVHHEPAPVSVVPTVTAPPAVLAAPAATSAHAVMRLAFDADALLSASAALTEHFGRPAPLAVFVARAAARHVGTLGLTGVGVYGTGEDTAPVATPNLTGDFRAAVADLTRGDAGTASDLMVIDAGELGLDELHLPGAGVTLALGRVREGQATLTLAGPVAIRSGAAFVQAVADLLETPIRLMI